MGPTPGMLVSRRARGLFLARCWTFASIAVLSRQTVSCTVINFMHSDQRGEDHLQTLVPLDRRTNLIAEALSAAARIDRPKPDPIGLQKTPHLPFDVNPNADQSFSCREHEAQLIARLTLHVHRAVPTRAGQLREPDSV